MSKALWIHRILLSHYINLLDKSISLKSISFFSSVHAQLIKLGFNRHTLLGSRCLDLYSNFGSPSDAFNLFDEISDKRTVSWNTLLKGLVKAGDLTSARHVFDEMPERNVISWTSMISGLALHGFAGPAISCFLDMQRSGVTPSGHTYSTLLSFVPIPCLGKEIHARTIRNGMVMSNVVIGNSLISMYGEFGLVDYALSVFQNMPGLDIISWNSIICSFVKANRQELALEHFALLRFSSYAPDGYTLSLVFTACSDSCCLDRGYEILACCIKMGIASNPIVASSAISHFAKCGKLNDSVCILADANAWDSAICDFMISSFARNGFLVEALDLFVSSMRNRVSPTEFMVSYLLHCAADLVPMAPGLQVHSLAVKLGFDSDYFVACTLVDMYAKYGMIDSSLRAFSDTSEEDRDSVCWNTMIMGLTRNGRIFEALTIFGQMLDSGVQPNHITFSGALMACNYGDLVAEGISIFSAMEKQYSVAPVREHYECVVGLLCRAGKLKEAIDIVETLPCELSSIIWKSVLSNVRPSEELELIERVCYKMIETRPYAHLPYMVLSRAYMIRAKWDSLARINKIMKSMGVRKAKASSWVWIRNYGFEFDSDEMVHYGGLDIYLVLRLVNWEMQNDGEQATMVD